MKKVLITFAERPTKDYPLAVVIIDDTIGARVPRSQDYGVRSIREGRIFANGLCTGAMHAASNSNDWPINPELDARLKFEE